MPRIVKEEEYAIRRNEILDAAQRFLYTKGYEQMTIQDILDELQISKGAFYHYFDSKQALLEALVERMMDEAQQVLLPIVEDPQLPALEKLQRYFDTAARWKTARKALFLSLMRVWYADENAIVRQKLLSAGLKRVTPLLAQIIHQGIQEGVFTTPYPDQAGEVIYSCLQGLGDTLVRPLLLDEPKQDDLSRIATNLAAYSDAMERVLGAPTGSLKLVDIETLKEWFVTAVENA